MTFRSKRLEMDKQVSDCRIVKETTLDVVARIRDGMQRQELTIHLRCGQEKHFTKKDQIFWKELAIMEKRHGDTDAAKKTTQSYNEAYWEDQKKTKATLCSCERMSARGS